MDNGLTHRSEEHHEHVDNGDTCMRDIKGQMHWVWMTLIDGDVPRKIK